MKRWIFKLIPWTITVLALYVAFRGINFGELFEHLTTADPGLLIAAMLLTAASYALRGRRWQYLFLKPTLSYWSSTRVLILGFFMNNILPARTGELVRAHMGAAVTGEKRTLVLATIASERLLDGLMLSFLFVVFAVGSGDQEISTNMLWVAVLFAVAGGLVILTLWQRARVFTLLDSFQSKVNTKSSAYTSDRVQVFINGLLPLLTWRRLPVIALWTIAVWLIELSVFYVVSQAYAHPLPLSHTVLFLVSVNFSSLIPAAPGGIGVIELIAGAVLVSLGLEQEIALSMVMTQHFIQYLVVGIPGATIMLSWKTRIAQLEQASS